MAPPEPVRFDHAAATEAADQLIVTAESLIEVLSVLQIDYPIVTEDWTGRFREVFDYEYLTNATIGATSVDVLYQMAAVIRAKSTEALAANILYNQSRTDPEDGDG